MVKFWPLLACLFGVVLGCSNIVEEANVGQCLQHKYENGTFKVKKKTEEQLILEELRQEGPGPIKVVNRFYGGWVKVICPEEPKGEPKK